MALGCLDETVRPRQSREDSFILPDENLTLDNFRPISSLLNLFVVMLVFLPWLASYFGVGLISLITLVCRNASIPLTFLLEN